MATQKAWFERLMYQPDETASDEETDANYPCLLSTASVESRMRKRWPRMSSETPLTMAAITDAVVRKILNMALDQRPRALTLVLLHGVAFKGLRPFAPHTQGTTRRRVKTGKEKKKDRPALAVARLSVAKPPTLTGLQK
jgi:hypothetical protein